MTASLSPARRFCMFPIKFPSIWEMYKKAEASFWTGRGAGGSERGLVKAYGDYVARVCCASALHAALPALPPAALC